jgi:hypothetical protein
MARPAKSIAAPMRSFDVELQFAVYDPTRIIKAFSNCAAVKRIAKI